MKFKFRIVKSQIWDSGLKKTVFSNHFGKFFQKFIGQVFCLKRMLNSFTLKRAKKDLVQKVKQMMNSLKFAMLVMLLILTEPVSIGARDFHVGSHDVASGGQNSFIIPVIITNLLQTQSNFAPDLEIRYNAGELVFKQGILPLSAESIWEINSLVDDLAGTITLSMQLKGSLMVNPWDHFLDLAFDWSNPGSAQSSEIEIFNVMDTTSDTLTVYFAGSTGVIPDIDGNDSLNFSDINEAFVLMENGGATLELLAKNKLVNFPISLSKISPLFKFMVGLKSSLRISDFNGKTVQSIDASVLSISSPVAIGGDIYAYTLSAPGYSELHSVDIMFSLDPVIIEEIQSITPVQMGSLVRGQPESGDEYRVQLVSYYSNPADSGNLLHVLAKHVAGETASGLSFSASYDLEILSNPGVDNDLHLTMFSNNFDITSPDTVSPVTNLNSSAGAKHYNITESGLLWSGSPGYSEVHIYTPNGRFNKKFTLRPSGLTLISWSKLPAGVLIIHQVHQNINTVTKVVNQGK